MIAMCKVVTCAGFIIGTMASANGAEAVSPNASFSGTGTSQPTLVCQIDADHECSTLADQRRQAENDVMNNVIMVEVSGPAGARFNGQCTLDTAAGSQDIAYDGIVPDSREFAASGIACRFSTRDTITIEVRRNGNVSRTSTTGGTVSLNLR